MNTPALAAACIAVWAALSQAGPVAVAEPADSTAAAEVLLDGGDAAPAAAMFGRVLQADPTNAAAMAGRVRALIRQDLWRQALEEARRFHEQHPAGVVGALGEALVRAGLLTEARALLETRVEGDGVDGRTLATYARVLAAAGRAEAESYARRAVEAAPEDRDVLLWASEIADERPRTRALLGRYLERAAGDDADRLTAATETLAFLESIGERRFWVTERRPERLELPLRPVPGTGGPSGYTIEMSGGEPGKEVRLLLDTGSTGLFMVERAARKLGLESLAPQTAFGGGGDQRHATRRGVLPEVAFGELRFKDALISTNDRPIHPTGAYHGVISLATFAGYTITIDMVARRLILGPPEDLPGGVPYWTVAGQLLVEAAAGDAPGLFLLDTGTQASVLTAEFAVRIDDARLGGPAQVAGYGGTIAGARWIHGARVQFHGRSTPGHPLRVVDLGLRNRLGGVELAGFAGLDLFDRTRLVLDTTRQRIVLHAAPER